MVSESVDMKGVVTLLRELRDGQAGILKDIGIISKTLNSKIDKLKADITATIELRIKNLRDECTLTFGGLESKLEGLEAKYQRLENLVETGQGVAQPGDGGFHDRVEKVERSHTRVEQDLNKLADTVTKLAASSSVGAGGDAPQCAEYDCDVSVIITGVRYSVDEDVQDKAEKLIHEGLDLPRVKVVRAMRTPFRNGKPGILKVQLESLPVKIEVLRAKAALRDYGALGNRVFIHGSRTHVERLLEHNIKTILDQLPDGHRFRMTGSGRLVRRDEDGENFEGADDQRYDDRQYDDRGRGYDPTYAGITQRGRGGPPRGAHFGRGQRGRPVV